MFKINIDLGTTLAKKNIKINSQALNEVIIKS
jgi:hypothetical protein